MSRRSTGIRLVAVAVLVAVAACRDSTSPTGSAPPSVVPAVQAPDLGTLARTVPGFGGLFLDHGVPTVYLTDVTQRGLVERALGGFARGRGFVPSEIRVLKGRYVYGDLARWSQAVSFEAFDHAGVVFVDLDEAANRVLVGVERGASHANVRSLAARLGVPAAAIETREVDPIHYVATLRDQVRPVVAGLQINFGNFVCSIGFNAVSGGQNSFVTASHCTNRQGGVEGTQYFQSLASQANSFIGTEVADPAYQRNLTPACPKGKLCRFSDAARASYAGGVAFTLGGIAQTSGPNNGSLTITGTFNVTSEGNAIVGDVANKVGRTTGWTQGVVTNTCVNTGVSGTRIVQLCQTFVSAGVGGGDSGSDVFGLTGGSSVRLLGILWGGNGAGTQFVYSPISNVEQELGPLTTF
ncbi:MAG TPA: hypothetical protein VK573_01005 [Gemmatimonadales bacterium]|nr:hypothetical protein [Gemmatimonadales bacterium]